jgi:hypothetical protein
MITGSRTRHFRGALAVAFAFIAKVVGDGAPDPGRARAQSEAPTTGTLLPDGGPYDLAASFERTLKGQHDRMVSLANQLLKNARETEALRKQIVSHQMDIPTAQGVVSNAKLEREIAEIEVIEYEAGISAQDEAVAAGELKLSESDLQRARDMVAVTQNRVVQIAQRPAPTCRDLASQFRVQDVAASAALEPQKRELALEAARAKLKSLREFTRPRRLKELKAKVEKARAAEFAKNAEWELAKSRLKRMEQGLETRDPAGSGRNGPDSLAGRAFKLLDRAIPIEEKLRARLAQLAERRGGTDALKREIEELSLQLESTIIQAEFAVTADHLDRLKPGIRAAAK